MKRHVILPLLVFAGLGCQRVQAETRLPTKKADFEGYWNRGEAELTSYRLKQARYGELHEGHAALVFVTEPFSKAKQVKLDNARAAGTDHAPVLKLNFNRKFNTGVYPYSMMTSVFAPIDGGAAIKVTSSSQEWCGHTFMQLNKKAGGYSGHLFSYFESEGDKELDLKTKQLEDELWTQIRLAPDALPTGSIELIPGATHLRLRHLPMRTERAVASLENKGEMRVYRVKYETIDRELTIEFKRDFPHEIEGWTERYVSGWGPSAETLTTTARRNKRIMSDYWARHSVADAPLRRALGLP